jgi:Acyl transferase domain
MKIAFVFPGQGSQSVGMLDAFADHPVVNDVIARAGAALGEDLAQLIAKGPAEQLGLTVNTQPVMLAAEVALFAAWRAAGGAPPAMVAGHSLGEYAALTAAGVFELEQAVRLVRFRAQAMQEAVPAGAGGMAAIIGLDDAQVRQACEEAAQGDVVEPVNFNAPSQVVIAGHSAALTRPSGWAPSVRFRSRFRRLSTPRCWLRPEIACASGWPASNCPSRRLRSSTTSMSRSRPTRHASATRWRARLLVRCAGATSFAGWRPTV